MSHVTLKSDVIASKIADIRYTVLNKNRYIFTLESVNQVLGNLDVASFMMKYSFRNRLGELEHEVRYLIKLPTVKDKEVYIQVCLSVGYGFEMYLYPGLIAKHVPITMQELLTPNSPISCIMHSWYGDVHSVTLTDRIQTSYEYIKNCGSLQSLANKMFKLVKPLAKSIHPIAIPTFTFCDAYGLAYITPEEYLEYRKYREHSMYSGVYNANGECPEAATYPCSVESPRVCKHRDIYSPESIISGLFYNFNIGLPFYEQTAYLGFASNPARYKKELEGFKHNGALLPSENPVYRPLVTQDMLFTDEMLLFGVTPEVVLNILARALNAASGRIMMDGFPK